MHYKGQNGRARRYGKLGKYIFHSGKSVRYHEGISFVVETSMKGNILGSDGLNRRASVLQLKVKFLVMSIIVVYAETE
jgi:hypothetical protein